MRDEVEEGPRLDYKATQELDRPKDRREVAKDASSFANEVGGVVLYGIGEKKNAAGRPIPTSPYGIDPIANFESRVENIIVDSIRPTLAEWRIRTIPASSAQKVVHLLWIPESWVGVHMVESYGDNRYYRRGNCRAVEMTERDVAERYERLQVSRNHVDLFLASEELNYVTHELPSVYRSRYVIVPSRPLSVDFGTARMQAWAQSHPFPPWGLEASQYGARTRLNADKQSGDWDPYLEIYRNGAQCLWRPTRIANSPNRKVLAYKRELELLIEFLSYASALYEELAYAGPIKVSVEISHPTKGMGSVFFPVGDFDSDWTTLSSHDSILRASVESSAATLLATPGAIAKGVADQWFQSYGYWTSNCFDDDLNLKR